MATITVATGIAAVALVCQLQAGPEAAVTVEVSATAVAATLSRCGLAAESLAAAGLDAQDASAVRAAIVAKLETDAAGLNAATESLASARSALDALRKAARGQPTQQESAQIAAATSAVDAAEASLASVIDQFATAGTASLSNAEKATVGIIRSNATRTVPAPYLVQTLDDEAYVRLRDALAAERTAQKLEEEVPAEAASYLATVRAVPAVSAALSNTSANLAAIKAALAGG